MAKIVHSLKKSINSKKFYKNLKKIKECTIFVYNQII